MEKYTFNAKEHLSLENSFGVISSHNLDIEVTIGFNDKDNGWFEIVPDNVYDDVDNFDSYYAEGQLIFEDKKLVDYDGVFALPWCIIDFLQDKGYDMTYAK